MAEIRELYTPLTDPDYQEAYIDIDEMRERTLSDGSITTFRYVHGGFAKKNLKFSFSFPAKEKFQGRFYQYLSPFPGPNSELDSLAHKGLDDKIAFCLEHGTYFVESNMGSSAIFSGPSEPKIVLKTCSAVAEYSRKVAMEMYGCSRPYGYVFGGSGSSYKTFSCIENTSAWDGAVPYVIGSPVSLPNTITLQVQGQRTLRKCFGKIVDTLEPGGSGDMYAELNEDERRMLKEITAMGFPPRSWYVAAIGEINDGSLPVLAPTVKAMDPQYFEDFWKVDGYLGADPNSSAVKDRIQFDTVVKRVHVPGETAVLENESQDEIDGRNGVDSAWKQMLTDIEGGWIQPEELPEGELYLNGCNICVESGEAAGKKMLLGGIEDGTPNLPQRRSVLGTSMTGTGGTIQHGDFQGKVIVIQSVMDCPWCGDWHRSTVIKAKGSEKDFRIYYMDHCMHGDEEILGSSRIVNYVGALKQALLDVSDWVERGIEPVPSTNYSVKDGQVLLPEKAADRGGIQPVVEVKVNGGVCAHVKAGEEVTISARIEAPHGGGIITRAAYGFQDSIKYMDPDAFEEEAVLCHVHADNLDDAAEIQTVCSYEKPGTYFVSVIAQSSRDEDDKYTQIKNLGRARIIVEA